MEATERHRRTLVAASARRLGRESPEGEIDDLSIVVDVGNGVGGVTADALVDLGAAVETLNANPDGRLLDRLSEPTAKAARRCVTPSPAAPTSEALTTATLTGRRPSTDAGSSSPVAPY